MTIFVFKSKETDFAFVTTGLFKELISKKLLRRDFSLLRKENYSWVVSWYRNQYILEYIWKPIY